MADHKEEDGADKDPQTFSIEASYRAFHGLDVLQNAIQEVTGPTQDVKGCASRRLDAAPLLPPA